MQEASLILGLDTLHLYRSPLTPEGFKELGKLTNLRSLTLGHEITDADVKELAGLTRLETLNLQQNGALTDACLKSLVEMENLSSLAITDTQVTGVGFKHLAGLKRLRELWLFATPTNDAGLKEIAHLKGLQKLYLHETRVSNEGVAALNKALPYCEVIGAPSTNNQAIPGKSP
ncbi:MAG: hypothetical protein EXR98_22840 [Gemmataceae bacterium]|nr:hypothetical protein [Gemmataceae bacterium]